MTVYQKKDFTQGHLRQIIQERKKSGQTCRKIAQDLGIGSTRTVSKRSKSESLDSKSSRPINPKRKYSVYHLSCLFAIRKLLQLSLDDCVEMLEQNNISLARSSCGWYLKQWGLTEKISRVVHKFKEYDPGYIHIDITYGPKINGKKSYIYVAIDRATRWLYLEVHEDKKADTAAQFLKSFLELCPFKVDKILTDNGKEFTLRNHKGKQDLIGAFDHICNTYHIDHRLTLPYHPRTNGMCEKANGIIKENTVKVKMYATYDEMNIDLKKFMYYYNTERRHGGLVKEGKGKTPYDAICMYYALMPEIFHNTPLEFLEKIRIYCLG